MVQRCIYNSTARGAMKTKPLAGTANDEAHQVVFEKHISFAPRSE
jgi:hypothetical protein